MLGQGSGALEDFSSLFELFRVHHVTRFNRGQKFRLGYSQLPDILNRNNQHQGEKWPIKIITANYSDGV